MLAIEASDSIPTQFHDEGGLSDGAPTESDAHALPTQLELYGSIFTSIKTDPARSLLAIDSASSQRRPKSHQIAVIFLGFQDQPHSHITLN